MFQLIFFTIAVLGIASVWWKIWQCANLFSTPPMPAAPVVLAEPVPASEPAPAAPALPEPIAVSQLFVRYLGETATLLVRFRRRKKAYTAHLIVWSGAKKKKISDSYFDLGIIKAEEHAEIEAVMDEALSLANQKLADLAAKGKRKRREAKAQDKVATVTELVARAAEAATPVLATPVQAESKAETSPVVIEENPPETIRLRKFPSVYRGVITEIGMMKQCKDGREFETFGVRYITQDGLVEAVYGANLRVALQEAKAGVGDLVEILKIGRKTITPGKAPMNLFQVAKLGRPA